MNNKLKFGKRMLAMLLCLSVLLPLLCIGGMVSAAEPDNAYEYSSDLSDFASDVTIYDDDLQEVGKNGNVYFGKIYDLIVTFTESAGDENEAGKQFKYIDDPDDPHCGWLAYELPGAIRSIASECEVMITRNDGTKLPIGTFITDDEGHAYVQFGAYDKYGKPIEDGTNFIDYYPDATFTLKFSCTVLDNGESGDKTLDLGDDLHITVHVVNDGDLDVTKTADKYDYATDTITYHAHVAAVNGTVTDTTITDTATSGQLIDPNSFVILDQDGNDVTTNFTPVVNGASFTIELGEMLAETFYDITYRTQIPATAQGDTVWFDNSCVVNGTDLRGNPTEDTAHFGQNVAFFRVMKKGDQTMLPVTENGVTQNKTAVKWSVTAENGRGTIGAATLADTPDGHQTLYTQGNSLALSWINADHRGGTINIPWSEVTLSPDGSSFSLELPIVDPARDIDTTGAIQYTMTYYTLTDIADGSVSNTAIFTDEYGHGDTETQSINLISGTAAVTKTVQLSDDDNYLDFVVVCNVPANRTDLPNFYISDTAFFSTPPLYVQRFAQPALFENLTISVDVMDADNTHIDMTPYVPGSADTENTFYVQYPNAGQANIYFNGVTGGGWDSRWHIAEPSVITLKYSLPLDSPVLDNRYALTGMTVRQMLAEGERFENDATLAYGSGAAKFTRVYYTAPVQKTCDETTDETTGEPIFHYQVELLPTSGQDKNFGACIFNTKDENGQKVADVTTISFIDEFDDRFEYVPDSLKCSLRYSYTGGIAEFNYAGNASFSGGKIVANFADFELGTYVPNYFRAFKPQSTLKLTFDSFEIVPFIYDFSYDLRLKDADHPDENVLHLHNTAWFEWDDTHSTPPVDCEVQHRTNLINKGYVQDGDEVAFTIEVNPTGKDLLEGVDTITLKDTMSENLSVFWDSLHVLYLNKAGEWVEISHVDSNATYIPEENAVMVTIPDETYVKIEYNTLITETGNNVSIGNTVTVVGYGSFNDVVDSTFVVSKSDASASAGTGHFTLIKNGSDGVRLSGAVFDLYSADSSKAQTAPEGKEAQITVNVGETPTEMYYVGTYTTGADGTAFVENVALEDDHYFALIETQAPAGYLPLAEPYVFNFNPNALSRETGSMPQVSNLQAITDAAIAPDKVVIDYGLPVEIHPLGNDYLSRHITGIASAVAADTKLFNEAYNASQMAENSTTQTGENNKIQLAHGTAYLTENGTIVYTPTDMQMSTEDVIFYEYTAQNGEIFYSTVTVIPAANMYYEFPAGTQYYPQDYIMFNNGTGYSWEDVGTTYDRKQAEDRPGENKIYDGNNVYGYDPAYNDTNAVTYSMGSAKKATVNAGAQDKEPTMEFTFSGNGFDFFGLTDNQSGVMLCQVYNSVSGKLEKNFIINSFYGYTYAPACFDTETGEQSVTGIPMYKMPSGILPVEKEELKAALPFLEETCGREVWEIPTYWTDESMMELTMVETAYPAYAVDQDGARRYITSARTTTTEATDRVLYFAPYVRYTDYNLIWSIPTYRDADGNVTYTATDDPMIAYGWFADSEGCIYQVPVIRCRDLDYGTYRVVVTPKYMKILDRTKSGSYSVYVDAVRIYNPAGTAPATDSVIGSAYIADKEYQPEYEEIRRNMLDADTFYAGSEADDENGISAGFTFIDGISALDGSASGSISNHYLHEGPNNELYLAKNQAVACYVRADAATAPAALQLGMKAITGGTGMLTVYNGHTKEFVTINVEGSSEQYRDLLSNITWNPDLQKQGIYQSVDPLLIVNLSDSLISLTNFKAAYDRSKPIRHQQRTQYISPKDIEKDIRALLLRLPTDDQQVQGNELAYTAASVTLKSDLSLNFFVPEEKVAHYTGVYALFSKAVYDVNGNVTRVNYPVYSYTLQEANGVQCRCYTFDGIAPQEIGSEVSAELHGVCDGAPYHGSALSYSVQTYVQNMLAKTEDEALRTVLVDLLNYGAAAQNYAGYRLNSLANADLSEEQQARANSYLTLPVSCTQVSGEQNAAASFRSATLILKNKISICVSLNIDSSVTELTDLEAVFSFTDINGNQTESIVPGNMFLPNQGGCTVTFDGLNAALLRTPISVTIRNINSGVTVSNTLTYSVESYAASMQNAEDALLTNLLRAMMNYGDSAAAYVQK